MPSDDYSSYVLDCLNAARVGPVTRERLFSGSGLRIDGELFGVILRGVLYFVVDDQTRPRFVDAGMGPFVYSRKNEQQRIERWYELPEDVLLDGSDLRQWVLDALGAARRTAKPKPVKKPKVAKPPAAKKVAKKTSAVKKSAVKTPPVKQKAVKKKAVEKKTVKKPVVKKQAVRKRAK